MFHPVRLATTIWDHATLPRVTGADNWRSAPGQFPRLPPLPVPRTLVRGRACNPESDRRADRVSFRQSKNSNRRINIVEAKLANARRVGDKGVFAKRQLEELRCTRGVFAFALEVTQITGFQV